ncbi:MAG: carbohydrate binding domain-containing protein, partial [Candidatus Omnitrophica bacterium]|nr:carbohydrate binding domain-containing protein [Candidatus Omnitrophota bacterium]
MKKNLVFLAGLLIVGWLLAGENLLVNSGFENSSATVVGNWRQYTYGTKGGWFTVVNDRNQAHSGNICLKLETEGKGYIGVMQAVGQAWAQGVWPGRRYLVGGYARGKDATFEIAFHLYGEKLNLPKGFKNRYSFPVTEEWQRYGVIFTMPEGVVWANVNFDLKGGQRGPLVI